MFLKIRPKASTSTCLTPKSANDYARWDGPSCSFYDKGFHFARIHNKLNPDNKITNETALGVGAYGAVFLTEKGVIKFDRSASETRLYANLPRYILKHSVMPQNVEIGSMRVPESWRYFSAKEKHTRVKVSTIHREEIGNIPAGAITLAFNELYSLGLGYDWERQPSNMTRQTIYEFIRNWSRRLDTDSDFKKLKDEEKKNLRRFARGIMRLVRFGIIPRDMHQYNIGQRKDGTFALRDLGVYCILDDTLTNTYVYPKKQDQIIRKDISKITSKLREVRNATALVEVCV